MTVLVANETSEFIVSEHGAVLKFLVAKKIAEVLQGLSCPLVGALVVVGGQLK